jgi:hypothetical protein
MNDPGPDATKAAMDNIKSQCNDVMRSYMEELFLSGDRETTVIRLAGALAVAPMLSRLELAAMVSYLISAQHSNAPFLQPSTHN